ncbi:hypothetical protein GGI07_005062 [Coemansia sp. Benny D115]|nr:hypothetical protein GGI07_005062 [Coemansia sp. Benny D115]
MVFSLGETLTETDFNDCQKLQALQDRLAKLSKLPVQESMDMDDDGSQEQQKKTKLKVIGRQPVSMELPKQGEAEKQTSTPGIKGIPQVVAAADLERNKRRFRMYDAVHEEDQEAERSGNKLDKPAEVDDLVPLVRDYLSLGHAVPEYVYDFYYVHQQSLKMEMDPRVLRASNLGMVSWIDDIDDLVDDEESSCLDDDDDDSNAEDYYANDYPDNPDSDAELDEYYYSSDERERLAEDQDLNW